VCCLFFSHDDINLCPILDYHGKVNGTNLQKETPPVVVLLQCIRTQTADAESSSGSFGFARFEKEEKIESFSDGSRNLSLARLLQWHSY
jgi:hypothetical protein